MTIRSTVPIGSMSRRQLLTVLVATPVFASFLAACGSDAPAEPSEDSVAPDPTDGPTLGHPTGADDLVLRIEQGRDAYTTPGRAFAQLPTVLLTGDGTLVVPGPQIEIYPPPLLPSLQRGRLTVEQIEQLLSRAETDGLLAAPPDYVIGAPQVADAGSTIVTLAADGGTFVHAAPALLVDEETTEARRSLAEFVAFATGFVSGLEGQAWEAYEATTYLVSTMVVNNTDFTGDVAPTVVPWPEAFGDPRAATTGASVELDGATVRRELASANELTFFDISEAGDGSTLVQVLLRPVLPS